MIGVIVGKPASRMVHQNRASINPAGHRPALRAMTWHLGDTLPAEFILCKMPP
jgi:hypothetical protein